VSYRRVATLFRELGPVRNGTEWLLESARHLHQSSFIWENSNDVGSTTLLSGIKINKKNGEISFAFDPFLKQMLLKNELFSRLRLHFIIGLQGKYSVSLYILLQGYVNRRHRVCELTLDQLRESLAVPAGRLGRYIDLMKNAIQPAMEQINSAPQKAGFTVEFEPILLGRRVTGARFIVTKHATEPNEGVALPDHTADEDHFPIPHPARIILDDGEALRIIRRELPRADGQSLLADFKNEINDGREIDNMMGYLTGWCRRRAKNTKSVNLLIDNAAKARRSVD